MDQLTSQLCAELQVAPAHAANVISLLDEGNTVPFIARYRKELTGSMDDQLLRKFADRLQALRALAARKEEVRRLIAEQDQLTDALSASIEGARTLTELEDLYRPYRPKRRTRASVAREKGLEPLATLLLEQTFRGDLWTEAARYVDAEKGVASAEEALAGASDIVAETISDNATFRKEIRRLTFANALIVSQKGKQENETYQMYHDFSEPVKRVADHRVLAMNRGEKEGALRVSVSMDESLVLRYLSGALIRQGSTTAQALENAIADSYKRLIAPSIETELRGQLTERAQESAIALFALNLKNLLLVPPVAGHVVLGVDPGYRTGCKLAVVDATGKVLETGVGYFTLPHHDKAKAKAQLTTLLRRHGVTLISIGNGTATGESEAFVAEVIADFESPVRYMIVSEAGASVYSASPLAAEEFPDYDVSLRSAVSIARRLQDPLAELVKIDPKAIGVGQYQHDCNQKQLSSALGGVVEDCVNAVGVDLNTASAPLLGYIAGISAPVAKNIVAYRESNGRFQTRKELKKVAKLGEKAFLQCAGFLRIPGGKEFLDNTSVHPESYHAASELLTRCGYDKTAVGRGVFSDLNDRVKEIGAQELCRQLNIGLPTLRDMTETLQKPGRDPRDELPKPLLRQGMLSMEDLSPGMVLEGTVRNVIDFGAFVDIGVHQDGLVHVSQISNKFIKNPTEVLRVGDVVKVKILDVDTAKKRISLTMKNL